MKAKKILAGILAASTAVSLAACNSNNATSSTGNASSTSSKVDESKNDSTTADNASSTAPSGEKITLKVLTHRTDRKDDGSLDKMTDAFEEKYNCTVEYQSFKSYADDVSTMMSTKEYGDVLMIPDTVKLADLSNFFEPLGKYDELKDKYKWADQKMYDGTVYGLAHLGSVSGGICYNKKVWADAGITKMPKTADEFIADLKKIKEKFPDVIPYYTNFKEASWTASQWSSLVVPSSGNPNFETDLIVNKEDFFTEGKPYYNVFKLMYDIYSDPTLIEGDPMSSDWEGSKLMIAKGEVATMTMGSWAVSQFQQIAKDNNLDPENIGYMPAPFSKDGKQYAQYAADYCMGVNKNIADDKKDLGKKYIEWFIAESGFSEAEGGINTLEGSKLPDYLSAFDGCEFFTAASAPEGLTGVFNAIDKDSEVGIWTGDSANFKLQLAEAAFAGKGDAGFKAIADSVNQKWAATRDANAELEAYIKANG